MNEILSNDEKFISNIFNKYLKAKLILSKENSSLHEQEVLYSSISSIRASRACSTISQFIDYQQHLQIVDTILALLPKEEYVCLVQDFLTKDTNDVVNNWWTKHYSENTYKKLKYKAISRFLYLFLI